MKRALLCVAPTLLVLSGGEMASPQQVWKADIRIRTVEVTRMKSSLSARVVVYTENDDAAENATLLILLPVGVGIERLAPGCTAMPGPPMVPALRATITCEMGAIPDRGYREVTLTTTLPSAAARLGVFTYSSTPDPVPGNNYAERIIP